MRALSCDDAIHEAHFCLLHHIFLAIQHGNEPSKGAKIDEALEAEDQAILRKKGIIKD